MPPVVLRKVGGDGRKEKTPAQKDCENEKRPLLVALY